jgi:hypothetical protein
MATKVMGILGLTAVLAAAACVSSSVIAAEIHSESACTSSGGGSKAYKWAWATAVAGGVTSGVCVGGVILMLIA